MESWTGITLYR